ncbi:SDR family NAD(P)-dependent oxidoreductase [Acetobacter thailandicus]|uniref:SDR family NAD(P)-dependent oxidoreductase n=1 Tax=Acetobacter thailandicus TaxID=1502842 RepID=UPI001BA4F12F|nr:SDR family NAD(P)-dependent oxidoreductase [Acetobacter thailandicus]MBS1004515.1 SDR family NAD(P)-dependent oxidoreductase [Acetobacter thailandicus]
MKKDPSVSWRPIEAAKLNLQGKKAIVVGGTGGLGRAITQRLVTQGASVTVVGQTFRDATKPNIDFVKADLSLMSEAQRVAKELPAESADILLFTAGIFASPKRQVSKEGLELDMAVSFLNRLVMTRELAPRLGVDRPEGSIRARIFNMAYPGSGQKGSYADLNAEQGYKALPQHMNTVAGNEMLVLDTARRFAQIDSFGLNPGLVKTNIRSNFLGHSRFFALLEGIIGAFNPTPEQYADRIVPLLVSSDITGKSGVMFDKKAQAIKSSAGLTDDYIATFLAASERLVAHTGVKVGA